MKRKAVKESKRVRLAVFRSNKAIYAQIIDDGEQRTLVAASEKDLKSPKKGTLKLSKTEKAKLIGKILAEKAIKKDLKQVKFDRRSYQYHGRVKALAEGAREGGLDF